MKEAFDAGSLERGYAFLDDCPEQFLPDLITLPVGTLAERVRGLRAWRDALLDGRLPPDGTWPLPGIAAPARLAAEPLDILRFCKGQPELVNAFLRDVLVSFTRQALVVRAEVVARLRELEQLERQRMEGQEAQAAKRERQARKAKQLDEVTVARLRQQAEREVAQRPAKEDTDLLAGWEERTRIWATISDVFGDLGELMGRGWDLSIGVLRHMGWTDLVRLRELVEQLPQLTEVVRSLGRLHASDAEETIAETVFVPMRRLEEERREVWTRRVPAETRGIERSGELARMLPVEAVNLGHPKLRYLWHARRAERALLTYRVEGLEVERTLVERDSEEAVEQRSPRPRRGPIIAVMDTSGSMHGLPEQVGKALVLEALRTAHAEKRRCFLYAYSGPGQVLEFELSLTEGGLGRLLAFLGQSFEGGSDVSEVTARVVQRLGEKDWKRADVLFVSDGEWPVPVSLPHLVEKAREAGTRFHGVQIGNRGRTGLHAICDPVHVFEDWAAVGGW
ncbi:VWA domain-containing protein [Myxococcus sp. AB036A]|uniref:VWA domain-containing protein n=1 Tax=Myxococcus sp. AB036A TaxID=2562793 RepID=UPI00114792D9|nr:VWA domain-containing protein [Myxococcus sp. AB036A]